MLARLKSLHPVFWLILLSIPAFRFLLLPGQYWNMQDDMQLIRQMEMEKCFKDGQIPCRWVPDLGYGYGYPEFNFYPPLPYLVGQVVRLTGVSYVATVKIVAILHFLAAGLAMYLLVGSIFGPTGGLISALFYVYAPYRALNIYVRGAINEAWASVFFPLIFYFVKKTIDQPRFSNLLLLALSTCGLLLSHNPMAMVFSPVILFWAVYWLIKKNRKVIPSLPQLLSLSFSFVFGLSLSAFFTLPAVFETRYVQIDTMFRNYFSYLAHFTNFKQLFVSNFWGDGPSVWGPNDQMSFMLGYLHWLLPASILLLVIYRLIRRQKINQYLSLAFLLSLLGFVYVLLTHERATPLWVILTPLQKIQFPWRLLNIVIFLFSLAAGAIPKSPKIVIPVLILLIVLNFNHFYPVHSGPLTQKDKFSGQAWVNQITSGIYDYLPKTARIAAQAPAQEFIDSTYPPVSYRLTGTKHGTDWLFFNIFLPQKALVYISQLAFPNFQVSDSGQKIAYLVEPELGRIVLDLDQGNHQIYLKLHNTPIRTVSNAISFCSWLILLFLFSRFLWTNLTSRK